MDQSSSNETATLNRMFGTYADILFVLFPFLVIIMQHLWDGNMAQVLLRPDLSIASAILAGLAIGKFVLGLVTDPGLGDYKERIVFFIALTLFLVMGPALILILSIEGNEAVPGFVAFLQPVLLIVAISLYTTAISISNMLSRPGRALDEPDAGETGHEMEQAPARLVVPRRGGADNRGAGAE
ncbi:hypothetical protein C8D92_10390 [Tamilnaduibacter salinus]|uniref:Uncharacterized protein n=1 Tax=Tamilnaduibacter salinus TaxID=1484056 RepID=A0A2U1CY19_9GAMM|nr:hypothetical protein [Tamilnaduibacter salinus]PVY77405.1 hypothetical protein C8D92_10390 [Tamilnaduibacter salinus]